MPARQHHRAMLRHVGGKPEAQPPRLHVIAFHSENFLSNRRLDQHFVQVPISKIPDLESLVGNVRKERAGSQLIRFQHLAKQVAINRHLFAPADETVIGVIRVRHVRGPADEPVRPGNTVNGLRAPGFLPAGQLVGPGQHHLGTRSGLEKNGRLGCAVLLDDHLFPVDAVANHHCVARPGLPGRLGDGFPRAFRGPVAVVAGLRVELRHFVSRGWNGNCEGERQPRRVF